MAKQKVSTKPLNKLLDNYPKLQKSTRATLKIKTNTYEKIKTFDGGTGTISSRINHLLLFFAISLKIEELSSEDFAFLKPLHEKDQDNDNAIDASVKTFHSLKDNNNACHFYNMMTYAFSEEKSFIKAMKKNVFDRKDLITKTFVMSSFSKRQIELLSKIIGIDKSTTFDFIINVSYQTNEGKKIEDAKRHYKPYKAIFEKLWKLDDHFLEVKKEIREILEGLGLDEYGIDELFNSGTQIPDNYDDVDPIEAALGTFGDIQTMLTSDVLRAVQYAVKECEKLLKKEASHESI